MTLLSCAGQCAMQVDPAFLRVGRQELFMQESYRDALYKWAQPPAWSWMAQGPVSMS